MVVNDNTQKEILRKARELNPVFSPLYFEDRIRKIYEYYSHEDIIFTTSFGTKSIFLIHLIHKINPLQKIHFINTTYHFPETIGYMEELKDTYNLEVIEVLPEGNEHKLTTEEQWWKEHPKMCCTLDKWYFK